jgi:anti-anti-sigma factor
VELHAAGIAVVKLRGEHDLGGKAALVKALSAASEQLNVLVDLSECTFMDSSVIAALVPVVRSLNESDGRLELVIPPEATNLHRVAKLTGLADFVPIHETQSAGFASFQPREHTPADGKARRGPISARRHGMCDAMTRVHVDEERLFAHTD